MSELKPCPFCKMHMTIKKGFAVHPIEDAHTAENERLRGALEFYTDIDIGAIARTTLATKGENDG